MKKSISAAALKARLASEKKRLKKLSFRLKVKIFLTVILPGIAALLAVETARTFLRVSLRENAAKVQPEDQAAEPQPVSLKTFRPDFITPQPVKSKVIWQSGKKSRP